MILSKTLMILVIFFKTIRASGSVQDAVHLPVLRSESQWPFGGRRGGDDDRTHPAVAW